MFYTIQKQIGFIVRIDVNARAQAAIYVSYNTALDLIAILKDWQYFQIKSPCIYEVLCLNNCNTIRYKIVLKSVSNISNRTMIVF